MPELAILVGDAVARKQAEDAMSRHVRERFPESDIEISRLYASDHEFRGICHDYGVCVEELRRVAQSRTESSIQRIEQLRELKADLESEIVDYLGRSSATAG